VFIKPF